MAAHIPTTTRTSPTSYFFILLLVIGVLILIYSFVFSEDGPLFSGLREIGLGVLLIGVGEWINHPLQKAHICKSRRELIFQDIRHRRRNPSALGNLSEIVGLILIFTGLADFF